MMIYRVNMKPWSSVLLLFVLTAFIVPTSCSRNRSPQIESSAKLTLAAYKEDVAALVYLADELGYYREHGLEVTIKEYGAGKLAVDAFLATEADLVTAAEFVFITNLPDNDELRILSAISEFRINELIRLLRQGESQTTRPRVFDPVGF